MEEFARTAMLIGEDGVAKLAQKRVAVFGIGGVGGHACEALVRAGVGALDFFDNDVVAASNLNRQLVALHSTLGQLKCRVMAQRALDINPACKVRAHAVFYGPDVAEDYPFDGYDYVVDAVDTVTAKLEIIARAKAAGVPVISSMGTGNKLHPERFEVADIGKTTMCPLARIVRKELKKRGIDGVKVVYSKEEPTRPRCGEGEAAADCPPGRRDVPGSISFVPGAAGLALAGAVVRDLLGMG